MFKTHKPGVYEYRLHAFTTAKGIFTLTGTSSDWIDTFKNLDTGEFHDWPRSHIKKWFDQGKISPVPESDKIDWHGIKINVDACRVTRNRLLCRNGV